jgi:hypothetical protein
MISIVIMAVMLIPVRVHATPLALVSAYFSEDNSSLLIQIKSSVGVSAFQIKLIIPLDLTLGEVSSSGFMNDAKHVFMKTEHRWFHLSTGGGTTGSINIRFTPFQGIAEVIMIGVDLKDIDGNKIPLDISLPMTINISAESTPSPKTVPITAAETSIYIEPFNYDVRRGQEFELRITIRHCRTMINGANMILAFDPKVMQVTEITPGEVFGEDPLVGFQKIDNSSGEIHYAIDVSDVGSVSSPKDTIAVLKSSINVDAPEGESNISLIKANLADENYEKITGIKLEHGVVRVITAPNKLPPSTGEETAGITLYIPEDMLSIKGKVGQDSYISVIVKNSGHTILKNISFSVQKPEGWYANFNPDNIHLLSPGAECEVRIIIKPGDSTPAGHYIINIDVETDGKDAHDRLNMIVIVEAPMTVWWWVGIGIIILFIVSLVVVFKSPSRRKKVMAVYLVLLNRVSREKK